MDYWQKFLDWIHKDCNNTIALLRQQIDLLEASEEVLVTDVHKLQERVKTLNGELNTALAAIVKEEYESELESYWNTKRKPTNSYKYRGRVFEGNRIPIDVRVFWTENNALLPRYLSGSNDEKALSALRWVANNITYTTDAKQFDSSEHWLFPFETLNSRKGDCEDGAIVLANIMLNSGIPYWRIRLNAGDVWNGKTESFLKYGEDVSLWLAGFRKEIENGTIRYLDLRRYVKDNDSLLRQSLSKALSPQTKETSLSPQEEPEYGSLSVIDPRFVTDVEKIGGESSPSITRIKTDPTILRRTWRFYVEAATQNTTALNQMRDSLGKDKSPGIKDSQNQTLQTFEGGEQNRVRGSSGHAWVTYLRESDDQWVVLDWCYWPNDSLRGLLWSDAENYFDIWFSWNQNHIFAKDMLDRKEE